VFERLKQAFGLHTPKPTLPPEDRPSPPRPQPTVVDVTDVDFADVVEASTQLAVVDFWADWCEPCETMSAHVGFLAQDFGDKLLIAALDVDENPATPSRFNVMGLPTLLFLRNGEEVERQVGIMPYEALQAKVERLLHEA
jgi:thioredoxin 1